jgi:TPP-dependent pyruvate/acetoin dehydrogenase alpha subunit
MINGSSHLSIGREAGGAGFGVAMRRGDKSSCTPRGHAHTLARGASIKGMLCELMLCDVGLMRAAPMRPRFSRACSRFETRDWSGEFSSDL